MIFQPGSALLNAIVLVTIIREPQGSYGYKIVEELQKHIDISESTLYPVLWRLYKKEYLDSYDLRIGGKSRRYYKITEKGRQLIRQNYEEWIDFSAVINIFLQKIP